MFRINHKSSLDYASEWTRDPGRGGFILIKAQPLCGGWLFLFLLHLQKQAFDVLENKKSQAKRLALIILAEK